MLGLLRGGANLVANLLQDVLRCVFGPMEILLQTCCFFAVGRVAFSMDCFFVAGKLDFMVERWWDPKDTSSLEM